MVDDISVVGAAHAAKQSADSVRSLLIITKVANASAVNVKDCLGERDSWEESCSTSSYLIFV